MQHIYPGDGYDIPGNIWRTGVYVGCFVEGVLGAVPGDGGTIGFLES